MHKIYYDLETFVDHERAKMIFGKKDYKPDPKLAGLDQVPQAITKLKNDALREERTVEWKHEQQIKLNASIEQARQKDLDRAALHWTTGKIVSVVAIGDGVRFVQCGHDEAGILSGLSDFLKKAPGDPVMIGKSNKRFDDAFLVGRMMVNRVRIPVCCQIVRPHEVRDVNDIFGRFGRGEQHARLSSYALALGFGDKLADGGDVHRMVNDNSWQELTDYNIQDVELTQAIDELYSELCY